MIIDTQEKVFAILNKTGAIILSGHFVGTSGLHIPVYINKDALYPHTKDTSEMGKIFAEKTKHLDIDVVVSPALGGIVLSQWTAWHLSNLKHKEVLSVYTEKTFENGQKFTRGYDSLVKGKKVLLVEDLTTTGGSVQKVIEAIRQAGGSVLVVSVMVNKSPKTVTSEFFNVPFFPLAELEVPSYQEKDCPMCKDGMPINVNVGHGKKYLDSKKQ